MKKIETIETPKTQLPTAMYVAENSINVGVQQFRAGIRKYDLNTQDTLEWLWGYTFGVLGSSWDSLCHATGYDRDVIYDIFTGHHEGDITQFLDAIAALRVRVAKEMPIVETYTTRQIIQTLDHARDQRGMVIITGSTGRGKTYTAEHWARLNNHGRSKFLRVPSGCSRRTLSLLLSQQFGIGIYAANAAKMEDRLLKTIQSRNVIIIDEAGHLVPKSNAQTGAIELLRDIHDITGCAIAMIFTDVYLKQLENGPMADYYEQFKGRIDFRLDIPPHVLKSEVADVCRAFIVNPTERLIDYAHRQTQQRDGKLRTLFKDLRRATDWAHSQGRSEATLEDLKISVDWRESGGIWPAE